MICALDISTNTFTNLKDKSLKQIQEVLIGQYAFWRGCSDCGGVAWG